LLAEVVLVQLAQLLLVLDSSAVVEAVLVAALLVVQAVHLITE
jgi:hypothetical protein